MALVCLKRVKIQHWITFKCRYLNDVGTQNSIIIKKEKHLQEKITQ